MTSGSEILDAETKAWRVNALATGVIEMSELIKANKRLEDSLREIYQITQIEVLLERI